MRLLAVIYIEQMIDAMYTVSIGLVNVAFVDLESCLSNKTGNSLRVHKSIHIKPISMKGNIVAFDSQICG